VIGAPRMSHRGLLIGLLIAIPMWALIFALVQR
jgi:hypothetical protein